jgi:tetratricopeptide (TPR) repeat protein
MAIKGSLSEASLPDVLQLLAMGGKTGCLSVTNRRHLGHIFFDGGKICFASVVNRRDRIGDLLVRNGLVTHEAVAAAVDAQRLDPERRVGELLIESGAIEREPLEHFLRLQIEEAVYHLFTWSEGSFFFETGQRPDAGDLVVAINAENVLLEGARRVDEWSVIEKKIPSLEMVFVLEDPNGLAAGLGLSGQQRRVLPLLDGRHSLAEIVDRLGLVEFEVGKAIFALLEAGVARCSGRRAAAGADAQLATRVDEHRNLGVAFMRTGMVEEALREFRRVLELEPGNRGVRYQVAVGELRAGRNREAIRELRLLMEGAGQSAAALLALATAFDRLGHLDKGLAAVEEALRSRPADPPALLSRAILLLKLERIDEARAGFEAYRAARSGSAALPAAYFAFSMLAEAVAGDLDSALGRGEEGEARYPHSAPLLLHLGAVHERRGDWVAAEALYRRACEEDPALPQAHKSLGDTLYRRGALAEAGETFRYALRLAPALGDDIHFKLGNIAYKGGDRPEAIRLWRRALELNPQNDVVRTNLEVVQSVLAESEGVPAGNGAAATSAAVGRAHLAGAGAGGD